MSYVLEKQSEFDRLEAQSRTQHYRCEKELADLRIPPQARILDAGCGSGIASRFLAKQHPDALISACDLSAERVEQARQASSGLSNIEFAAQDISRLSYPANHFDQIVCRYVLEHLPAEALQKALVEFHRCLKPGGNVTLIDLDGLFYNLYPRTTFLDQCLSLMENTCPVDLRVGRKLPSLLSAAGLAQVKWKIDTIECKEQGLETEKELIGAKLDGASDFLNKFFGGSEKASRFKDEYMRALDVPGVVLFYNKFTVSGEKSALLKIASSVG